MLFAAVGITISTVVRTQDAYQLVCLWVIGHAAGKGALIIRNQQSIGHLLLSQSLQLLPWPLQQRVPTV